VTRYRCVDAQKAAGFPIAEIRRIHARSKATYGAHGSPPSLAAAAGG
jgi:hypothetical protein